MITIVPSEQNCLFNPKYFDSDDVLYEIALIDVHEQIDKIKT